MADPPLTPDALFAALNAWVRSFDPRAQGLVILYESGGMRGKIPVPFEGDSEEQDDPSANLTVMERDILQVLRDDMKPGDVWTYDDIAKKAGWKYSGSLRAAVKSFAPALKITVTTRGCKKT